MKLLFLSNVYLIITSVFPIGCIGVLSLFPQGGEDGGVNYLHNWSILV